MKAWDLSSFTWPEVQNAIPESASVLVPVGAFEQHGPFLPLDTDARIARLLSEKAAVKAQEEGGYVLVGPTLSVGYSWYHMDFPGTVTLDGGTFMEVVSQVCRSLHQHGFRNIILLNAHGGNVVALNMTVTLLKQELNTSIYHVTYADLISDLTSQTEDCLVHAGEVETSICLALGIRVDTEALVVEAPDRRATLQGKGFATSKYLRYDAHHKGPGAAVPIQPIKEMSESGVVGDATKATVELGEELVQKCTERLAQLCLDLGAK